MGEGAKTRQKLGDVIYERPWPLDDNKHILRY